MADIQAVFERDPACDRYTHCILYFKGFQAIQCHRIAHWLWTRNRRVRCAQGPSNFETSGVAGPAVSAVVC